MVDEFKLEFLTTWPIHEELKKLEVLGKWGSLCCSRKKINIPYHEEQPTKDEKKYKKRFLCNYYKKPRHQARDCKKKIVNPKKKVVAQEATRCRKTRGTSLHNNLKCFRQ
jgi:hypothetical protein